MIIRDAYVYNNGFRRLDIEIGDDGKISRLGQDLRGGDIFDAKGLIALPGLHNNHMHASTSLMRGMPVVGGLDEWVEDSLWRFEKDMTDREAYHGSLYSICQMLRSGITYFEDMHFKELEVLRACEEAGIRASLSEALMDNNDWGGRSANIGTSLSLAKRAGTSRLVDAKLGIVSIRLASEDLVDRIAETYRDNRGLFKGYHMHMNETGMDTEYSLREYGMLPAQFFERKGVLCEDTTIAHCVHMDAGEVDILARRGVKVALCPASNLRLMSGSAPVRRMIDAGVRLSVGLDSPAINDGYDIFADTRMIGLSNNLGSDELLSTLLDGAQIAPGANADIILLDGRDAFPTANLSGHLCLSVNSRSVSHVMVDGSFVVLDGRIASVDEESVIEGAQEAYGSVRSRLEPG
ncbi:MAG TPA: amidohydrolase family protein [Candidatus Methanofastidiosa archaeon]|nr:amidohydrolase family protein [Candidatus Methanofastidiosa archaeon]